jgi:hypothetical protein
MNEFSRKDPLPANAETNVQNVEMEEQVSNKSKRQLREVDTSNNNTPRSSKKQQTEDPSLAPIVIFDVPESMREKEKIRQFFIDNDLDKYI